MKNKNKWIEHVKKTKEENPELKFKEILVLAKKTYEKTEDENEEQEQ